MIRFFVIFVAAFLFASPAVAKTWHRSDTHHFTIYSDGKKRQLENFSHEVERFDALLRLLFKKKSSENPTKLTIYLIESADEVDALLGPKDTNVAGFYRARTEGSFAVGNRKTSGRKGALNGKTVLFHEYAHHFMFQNLDTPAPAWFIEGFAEFVATAEFKRNGSWTFGKPALHRHSEVEYFGPIPIRDLLTKQPARSSKGNSFYGWSWALTHMLYSQEMGRGKLISQYLNLINSGVAPLEAAEQTFGDLDRFDRSLRNYVKKSIVWNKSPNPLPYRDAVTLTELSAYDSQIVALTLQRLGGQELPAIRDKLLAAASTSEATSEAWYQLAEAEFALAHSDDAAAPYDFTSAGSAVDQALAANDNHMHANVLKGLILLEPFDHEDEPDDENWVQSREFFLKAQESDPHHPLPFFAMANSFMREGRSDASITPSLTAAYKMAPESRELRFAYAINLAQNGSFERAIRTLKVIANDPHGGGGGAKSVVEQIERMRNGGSLPVISGDENDDGDDTSSEEPEPSEAADD